MIEVVENGTEMVLDHVVERLSAAEATIEAMMSLVSHLEHTMPTLYALMKETHNNYLRLGKS